MQTYTCPSRQAQEREINLTPAFSSRSKLTGDRHGLRHSPSPSLVTVTTVVATVQLARSVPGWSLNWFVLTQACHCDTRQLSRAVSRCSGSHSGGAASGHFPLVVATGSKPQRRRRSVPPGRVLVLVSCAIHGRMYVSKHTGITKWGPGRPELVQSRSLLCAHLDTAGPSERPVPSTVVRPCSLGSTLRLTLPVAGPGDCTSVS
jgi:hypothetical protein